MLNWQPESPEDYRDVQTIWQYRHSALNKTPEQRLRRMWRSSRDSARTPVQWSAEANAGFAPPEVTPWIKVNPNYPRINVADQEADPHSLLNFYRKAISLRKSLPAVRHGDYKEYFKSSGKLYVYSRSTPEQRLLVVCSFTDRPVRFRMPGGFDPSVGRCILSNYEDAPLDGRGCTLRPYECRVYRWDI